MAYRDIMVILDNHDADVACLSAAVLVAKASKACLVGTFLTQPFVYPYIGADFGAYVPSDVIQKLADDHAAQQKTASHQTKKRFDAAVSAAGLTGEWAELELVRPADLYAKARLCDLVVFPKAGLPHLGLTPAGLVMGTGGPVLLVPGTQPVTSLGHKILLGWNDSRESANALRGAMPLIHIAGHVRVVCVGEDKTLRLDIIDELDFEPSIRAQDIGVAVSNGVVTLTGHVHSYAEKLAVERTVGRIKGVKAVAMEMEVRLPSSPKTSDDEVAKRCVDILKWNVWTSETIQVKVEHGWVTLTGSVDWAYQRQAAERAIHALSGVRGVSNLIAIKPAIHPEDVRSTIEKAFLRNAELESGQIRVKANAGQVVLEGNVKTWHERQIAEQAAWSAPGVTSVDDRIRVS